MKRENLDIAIRDSVEDTLFGLRWWLRETRDDPLEEMGSFFDVRLADYPAHMYRWQAAYDRFPDYIPSCVKDILDLGCGSGLELDAILAARPDLSVTGIDLSDGMLQELGRNHPGVRIIRGNYLQTDLGTGKWDMVISFESLHHLLPDAKLLLYRKIRECLRPGGLFLNCDYYACCDEEEKLLRSEYLRKRTLSCLSNDVPVHFDIPLTLAHEADLLEQADFAACRALSAHAGACFLLAE